MKSFLIIFLFGILTSNSIAQQRPVLTDEEQITETVTNEINDLFKSKDFLKVKTKNYSDVNGSMTIDVGINENGKVSTFFKVDSEIKNINFINFMSEYILTHKFKFKLLKQQRYKVRYTIIF